MTSAVPSVLEAIIEGVREDVGARRALLDLDHVIALAGAAPPALDAAAQLRAGDRVRVIAEVKRASPSKGELAGIPDPAALAARYAGGGASAVSVLTEQRRFRGSLADLDAVRAAVDIPVLRKDFIVEPYQVHEARAHGADLVLLIVAALDDATLAHLHRLITDYGMTALVEIHDEDELDRALAVGAEIIGVNARNLKTLAVDPQTVLRLLPQIRAARPRAVAVAESGIATIADVLAYAEAGADAVLVGEALVTGTDPAATVAQFASVPRAVRPGR